MATATGPDLSAARRAVENLMDDTCVVVRPGAAVLNEATGAVDAAGSITVYDDSTLGDGGRWLGGRCKIKPTTTMTRRGGEGGANLVVRAYEGGLPWDAPPLAEGDEWAHTSSRRDPELVGAVFVVQEVLGSTMLVGRRVLLERRS